MSDASDARIKALVNALTLKLSEAMEKNDYVQIRNITQKLQEIFESNDDYGDGDYQKMITMRNTKPTYEKDDPHLLNYIKKSANNPLGDAGIKEYWHRRLKTLSQNGGKKKYYYKYKSNKKQFKNRRQQRQTRRRQRRRI